MKKVFWILALLSLAETACADQGMSPKALFYDADGNMVGVPSTPAAPNTSNTPKPPRPTPRRLAGGETVTLNTLPKRVARFFIRLDNPDGTTADVLASRTFASGERFHVGLQVSRASYVYIFNEDSKRKVVQLYPRPGMPERIDAMDTVLLPSRGAFLFDVEPGIEQVTVILADSPQKPDLETIRHREPDVLVDSAANIATSGCGVSTGAGNSVTVGSADRADSAYSDKGILVSDASAATCQARSTFLAKGIEFEDDPTPPPGQRPASYVSSSKNDLTIKLKLLHH